MNNQRGDVELSSAENLHLSSGNNFIMEAKTKSSSSQQNQTILSENGSIEFHSKKTLSLQSQEKLAVQSTTENITIKANKDIECLSQRDLNITMRAGDTKLEGKEVIFTARNIYLTTSSGGDAIISNRAANIIANSCLNITGTNINLMAPIILIKP